MDPPHLISESSLNPSSSSYNLAEIWPFSVNGYVSNGGFLQNVQQSGGRRGGFVHNLGLGYAESSNRDASVAESSVTEQSAGEMLTEQSAGEMLTEQSAGELPQRGGRGDGRKRREVSEDESSKLVSTSSGNNGTDSEGKRLKLLGFREENGDSKLEVEMSYEDVNKLGEESVQPAEPPKQDYIHVRARRGQATDSHSLAERARREKISERMKILQDLVPGCNKVIGKALVLDEIINYIQSLQRQVEFLSMKLEAVNSRASIGVEGFPSKDLGVQTFETASMPYGSQATTTYLRSPQEWLHMQVGGSFDRAT